MRNRLNPMNKPTNICAVPVAAPFNASLRTGRIASPTCAGWRPSRMDRATVAAKASASCPSGTLQRTAVHDPNRFDHIREPVAGWIHALGVPRHSFQ